MTDETKSGGEAVPAPISIDHVAALFERREAFERSEALRLADQVRAYDHLCRQQQDTIRAQAEMIEALKAAQSPPEPEAVEG